MLYRFTVYFYCCITVVGIKISGNLDGGMALGIHTVHLIDMVAKWRVLLYDDCLFLLP